MATWFAQTNFGNINAANMWNSVPAGGGTALTWPPAAGDVLVANNRAVTVNVNVNIGSGELRNDTTGGATAGGWFAPANGVSITANLYQGVVAQTLIAASHTGSVFLVGQIAQLSGGGACVRNGSTGTINITGNTAAGTAGMVNTSTGVINVTGDISISGSSGYAAANNGAGTIAITGNVTNAGTGSSVGALNNSTGTTTVSGYVQSSNTSAGASNIGQGALEVGETRSASNGRGAVLGAFRFASTTAAKSLPIIAGTQQTFSVLDVAALVPAVEDVRAGVKYGDGAYTGTLALQRKRQTMARRF